MSTKLEKLKALAKQQRASMEADKIIPMVEDKPRERSLTQIVSDSLPGRENAPAIPMSLSLGDPGESVSREIILAGSAVRSREGYNPPSAIYEKAKKEVLRRSIGPSAAAPMKCRGALCPLKDTCITGTAKISTPEGYKTMASIKKGDPVFSVDYDGTIIEDVVVEKRKTGKQQVYTITLTNGLKVEATSNHRFLTLVEGNLRYISIDQGLAPGHVAYIADTEADVAIINEDSYGDLFEGMIESIVSSGTKATYDITVKSNPNFIANNIVVHNCSYYLEGIHLEGDSCLEEEQLVEFWTRKYFDDLNIDPNSVSEVHALSRLVEITIYDLRMTKYMSVHDTDLMMDFITSTDLTGAPVTQKGVSVAFEIKDRLEKQKLKLLESLNSTRERRLKAAAITTSIANHASKREDLLDRLDGIARALRGEDIDIVDVEEQ